MPYQTRYSSQIFPLQDVCKPDRPAELTLEKLKLHYVVHYLYRGTWDHIVPEEDPALLGKIECYICNICHKRFKNHLEKKEYPGIKFDLLGFLLQKVSLKLSIVCRISKM